jgi:hypothetical protein
MNPVPSYRVKPSSTSVVRCPPRDGFRPRGVDTSRPNEPDCDPFRTGRRRCLIDAERGAKAQRAIEAKNARPFGGKAKELGTGRSATDQKSDTKGTGRDCKADTAETLHDEIDALKAKAETSAH